MRDAVLGQHVLQHRPLQQRRVAERRRREDHALGAARLHLLEQEHALLLALGVVLGRGRGRAVQEGLRQLGQRVAVGGHLVEQPAADEHEVVVDDVAAGHLDGLDQRQRRLLAEAAGEHDARVVALGPLQLVGRGQVLPHQRGVLLHRQHHAGALQQVDLGGRRLPRLGGAVGVKVTQRLPVVVIGGDRCVQLGVGDRCAAQLAQVVADVLHLLDVELAADAVLVVLRHVDVAHVLGRKQDLPHARQVADHVADAREEHAVQAVQPAGQAQLDGRARDAADVALVVGVALDHLGLVAAAEDAHRQHARRVDDLARHVHRHVADRLAAGRAVLPGLDGVEVQVLEQRLAARDDLQDFGLG